jgi:folate-dependent phosphoribosylglycinamide formyltransferase PurN
MVKPGLIVFASGSKSGGGSGFEKLVYASRQGVLNADIVAVVSNHGFGGVRAHADRLGIRFLHFPGPWTEEGYRLITQGLSFDFVSLSGWLKLVLGLDPRITFNVHPALLPDFGGPGMYGHHVHEAVLAAFLAGKITHSAVSMHFATGEYDRGPVFFQMPVDIGGCTKADDIGRKVNDAEHLWQPLITNMVVQGEISWDGKNRESLRVPAGYGFLPPS